MANFTTIKNFWFWCQKVLPLVYDDSLSYYEVLCQMAEYLNQVIDNVNQLPDFIEDLIKDYISSGDIQNALNEILANYNPINVKCPPADLVAAKGDGNTDDTVALQAMIDYAATQNMPLIFPAGVYRVSSLNIPMQAHFLGYGSTIFKMPNSTGALITAEGDFSAFNMIFNGNIAGQTDPQNVFSFAADNVAFEQCRFTGGVSCVSGSINNLLSVTNCHFENYTEYGIFAEGNGRAVVSNMCVDGVATSGALRFVRLDVSNSIVDGLLSMAVVPVAVEITGDFNTVFARVPNAENPINDGGENNNFNIVAQKIAQKATASDENMSNYKNITAEDIFLNPTNPLGYNKTPTDLARGFKSIPFKDSGNNPYNVLVATAQAINDLTDFVNVKAYGAIGDGIADDSEAFQNAINSGYNVYVPTDQGEKYFITGITINTISQTIFTLPGLNSIGQITGGGTIFTVNTENVRFSGLTIVPSTENAGTGIKINGNSENGASDCIIRDCRFGAFEYAIDNVGRGLEVENCRFVGCEYCVRNNYNFNGEGLQNLEFGNRAFRFENNRIHQLTYAIFNETGILRGAKIQGNVVDIGSCLITSATDMIACSICNNVVNLNTRSAIILTAGNYSDNVISGNVFESREDGGAYAIEIQAGVSSFEFNNVVGNMFKNSERDAIIAQHTLENCVISDNVFDNIANAQTSNADACLEFSGLTGCIICGNVFSQVTTLSALRGTTTSASVTGSIVQNNTHTATDIISSYQDSGNNQIQAY